MPDETPTLSVIVTHKDSPDLPILRPSFEATIGAQDSEFVPIVGAESIAKGYNQGVRQAKGKFFLFVHADVEIITPRLLMRGALQILEKPEAGVIGVAGSSLLNQTAIWWQEGTRTLGACMHRDEQGCWYTVFGRGRYGRVVVLDGVFLLVSRATFEAVGGFDESLPSFHFYDIDFTLRVHLSGRANLAHPFHIVHASIGDVRPEVNPQWHKNRVAFQAKWQGILPVALETVVKVEPERLMGSYRT